MKEYTPVQTRDLRNAPEISRRIVSDKFKSGELYFQNNIDGGWDIIQIRRLVNPPVESKET